MGELDQNEQTATCRRRGGANGRLLGLLLIGLGTVWFLDASGLLDRSGETARAGLLMLLGAGLIYTARRGRGGGRSLWPIVLGVILIFSLLDHSRPDRPPRVQVFSPHNIDDVRGDYVMARGPLVVDLSAVPVADLQQLGTVRMRVGLGNVLVTVPAGFHIVVSSRVGQGQAEVCGKMSDPARLDQLPYDNRLAGPPLTLDIQVARGSIQVSGCEPASTTPSTA